MVPTDRLGRVSACMGFLTQGVKPLGALAGGALVAGSLLLERACRVGPDE
jgi:hypothetical protein